MELKKVVCSQYSSVLEMLGQTVDNCPDSIWDAQEDRNRFWKVAYHALFFTHLYLQQTINDFHPWSKHREQAESFDLREEPETPYTKAEIMEYLAYCQEQVTQQTALLDPSAPSGFHWLPFSKIELQFYNIRHAQLHTGELMERLGTRSGIDVHWVGHKPQ